MSLVNYIFLIILSLFTTIVFVASILYSDRKSREPVYMILISLLSGVFTIGVSLILGDIIISNISTLSSVFSDTSNGLRILLLALIEEYSKLVVLYLFISRNSNFDDVYDGFVYSSLITLSFAGMETIMYVFSETEFMQATSLAVIRSITTVPFHLICGIVMGHYIGKEKFIWGTKRRIFNLIKALVIPTLLHFSYNYMLSNVLLFPSSDPMFIIIMIVFFIPYYIIAIYYIKKTILLNEKFVQNEEYKHLMTQNEYISIMENKY